MRTRKDIVYNEPAILGGEPCSSARAYQSALYSQMTLTGMKKHVSFLEQAGLVTTQKIGRVRTCKLGPHRLDDETAWITQYRERVFDAPPERVWRAMTDPKLVAQWWGRGNPLTVERLEVQRGGHWRFVEHSADGDHGFERRFREVRDGGKNLPTASPGSVTSI